MTGGFVLAGKRRKGPSSWAKSAPGELGLTVSRFEQATGMLEPLAHGAEGISIGALLRDPGREGVIYAVDEALTLPGWHMGGGGQVLSFRVDPRTGALEELSRQPSLGTLPCNMALDTRGEFLLVVHHTGHAPITRIRRAEDGSLHPQVEYDEAASVLFPLDADGRIGPAVDLHRHSGHGALPSQSHPQLHSVVRAPDRDVFVVCDKGADRIHLFTLDRAGRRLVHRGDLAAPPGSSPRYSVFNPRLPVVYVNFETSPILHVYRLMEDDRLDLVQSRELPVPPGPGIAQSDLVIHPNGRFLYTLVRGAEMVGIHRIEEETGHLHPLGLFPLGVRNARGAAISPDGRHFLVAAMMSQDISCWRIGADGLLQDPHHVQPEPNAACLLFA